MASESLHVTPVAGNPSASSPTSPSGDSRRVTFERGRSSMSGITSPLSPSESHTSGRRKSHQHPRDRPPEDAYHDSRAATKAEFRRRASTLQEYYRQNPTLLPQLPFTFRHGFKRWKLGLLIAAMVIDACIIPIVLYYSMKYAGNVQGWIIFAIVATIWGGPTYVEFAVRSWRLISKERFFRPMGASSRWSFDISHWFFVITITTTTTLLIVGSAPHEVWLRVLSMPGPGLLLSFCGCVMLLTFWALAGWKAPFRISSTAKGEKVHPGVYYIVEDIVAVNAGGGLPFREGMAARYEASPIFRKMIRDQSLFWSVPGVLVAIGCTVAICDHNVPHAVAYAVGWGIPFIWMGIWTVITIPWVRREMHKETVTWEATCKLKDMDGSAINDAPV